MPIVSWTIEEGAVQINGRLSIVERYQHDDGRESTFLSGVDPGTDLEAYAAARAAELDEWEANQPAGPGPAVAKLKDAVALISGGQDLAVAKTLVDEASAILGGTVSG
jgi:hypothetical protein